VTEWIYRVSARRGRVAGIGTPPRQPSRRASRVVWEFPEAELADVAILRAWLREHKVAGIEEGGHVEPGERLPPDGEPYHTSGTPWTPWRGPALTQWVPCEKCGLNTSTVTPPPGKVAGDQIENVLDALAETPLYFLPSPSCYVADPGLVDALRSAGLAGGLLAHPLDDEGRALLIWSDHAIGGPAYPYGPRPCETCGRAARRVGDRLEFVKPRYAYELSFEAEIADWSWSTVYGQQAPVVSHAVAELLLGILPTERFVPHGRPDHAGAFLPEQYQ
jgi:hypothetical protein